MGRIHAVDIEGRVGLRVAEPLGIGQHLGEVAALLAHHGEDVVAGAVEDAGDGADLVRSQPLAQRLDGGDAAGHRRFEGERHMMFLGQGGQFRAVQREERLVGGHDRLAGGNRRPHGLCSWTLAAADDLNHHIDIGVARQRHRVLVPGQPLEVEAAIPRAVTGGNRRHGNRPAGAGGDDRRIPIQQGDRAGADGAEARYANAQRFMGVAHANTCGEEACGEAEGWLPSLARKVRMLRTACRSR
jgi:hypothetical protein